MRRLQFNWGVVVAAIVLLGFSYITFLGMLYRENGTVGGALLAALGLIAVVAACVYFMSLAKATKWHDIGKAGQVGFGVVVVAAFVMASFPFTNFMSVWQHNEDITKLTDEMKQSAADLDIAYNQYATARIEAYGNAGAIRKQSLRRHIAPEGIDSCQAARRDWLGAIGEMKPWNIYLPANLKYMEDCVNQWIAEYSELSAIRYIDEVNVASFSYSEFASSMGDLKQNLEHPPFSFLALIIAIVAALLMMVPYWMMEAAPELDTEDLWVG